MSLTRVRASPANNNHGGIEHRRWDMFEGFLVSWQIAAFEITGFLDLTKRRRRCQSVLKHGLPTLFRTIDDVE